MSYVDVKFVSFAKLTWHRRQAAIEDDGFIIELYLARGRSDRHMNSKNEDLIGY